LIHDNIVLLFNGASLALSSALVEFVALELIGLEAVWAFKLEIIE
jgi:hypothetical protein